MAGEDQALLARVYSRTVPGWKIPYSSLFESNSSHSMRVRFPSFKQCAGILRSQWHAAGIVSNGHGEIPDNVRLCGKVERLRFVVRLLSMKL